MDRPEAATLEVPSYLQGTVATKLVPLFEERALLLETDAETVLVAGDLHLGLERELSRKGVHGLEESKGLVDHLAGLAAREAADRILLLGDVKHSIGAYAHEKRALAPLERMPAPVEVVPGNHDGGLAEIAPFLKIHDIRGITVDGVGVFHGHVWPDEALFAGGTIVLCHNHPHVGLRDELGHLTREPCWIRAPLAEAVLERYPEAQLPGEAVLVPAFNPLLGGVALNQPGKNALGPLLANEIIDLPAGRVYTLDGLQLGTLASLEAQLS